MSEVTYATRKCLHMSEVTYATRKCLHMSEVTYATRKCLRVSEVTYATRKCLHVSEVTYATRKCLHVSEVTCATRKCLHAVLPHFQLSAAPFSFCTCAGTFAHSVQLFGCQRTKRLAVTLRQHTRCAVVHEYCGFLE